MKKISNIFLIIFLIIIFSISLASCKNVGIELKPFDRSKISVLSVDRKVKVGDVVWKVDNVEYLGSQIPSETGSGTLEAEYGRFLGIEFTTENLGQDILTIIDLKVIDNQDREFLICTEAYGFLGPDNACLLVDLYPEIKQTFFASFDVPLDSVDLILEVSDLNTPPAEKAYIDLGI